MNMEINVVKHKKQYHLLFDEQKVVLNHYDMMHLIKCIDEKVTSKYDNDWK